MKKMLIVLVALTAMLFAGEDSAKSEFTFTPIIKSELVFVGGWIPDVASDYYLLLGEQDYGVTVAKGKTSVSGAATFSGELTDINSTGINVGLSIATITQGINDVVSLKFGYDVIPYGYWNSNSVNYPLARFGGYSGAFSPVRIKALQTAVGINTGMVESEIAIFQGTDGKFSSMAGKASFDLVFIAPTISIKTDNFENASVSFGISTDLGKVLMETAYFTGFSSKSDQAGAYMEVSYLATDALIVALRGETLNDNQFKNGETQFSLSTLYLLNDNVYFGVEYNAWMDYSAMDEPYHSISGLIGYEF